jgi:pyrroline-5-carboxylate reductase
LFTKVAALPNIPVRIGNGMSIIPDSSGLIDKAFVSFGRLVWALGVSVTLMEKNFFRRDVFWPSVIE